MTVILSTLSSAVRRCSAACALKPVHRLPHIVFSLLIVTMLISPLLPAPAQAAPAPVELDIGGAGSAPWDITGIKPGDGGTQMITIRNAGTAHGSLSLWVSDIVDTEEAVRPGVPVNPDESNKLSDHLLLEPISNQISSNMALPLRLADYPNSPDDAVKITVSPIAAGQTIDLIWQWCLPITVGNAVQANSVTFSLNYMLTEMPVAPIPGGDGPVIGPAPTATTPSPTPGGPTFYFIIKTPEKESSMVVGVDGTIAEYRTVDDISDNLIISFDRDTQMITPDNSIPDELRITFRTEIPDPPPGTVIVGPVYELLFYTNDRQVPVRLTHPARLILNYGLLVIPDYVRTMFVASWDTVNGWTQLQPVSGLIVGDGQIGAMVNHFTLFTILGVIEEDEEPTVIQPPLPAQFDVNNLSLSVPRVQSGRPATIRVYVENTGELSGEVLLRLTVNGLFVESRLVRLEPGQNRNVSFVITPFKPGEYEIEVNGLRDILVVTEGPAVDFEDTFMRYWPIPAIPILIGAGILFGLLAYFLVSRKRA